MCALDLGTSGVRASIVDRHGVVRSAWRTAVQPSAHDFDAEALWAATAATIRHALGDGNWRLTALACAGRIGVVLVDEAGAPVGPGVGWADTRGSEAVMRSWPDTRRALRRAGRPIVTGGAVPYLAWLRESDPMAHAAARWILTPKDFVILRLTGVAATDQTTAAYSLGFDVRLRRWSAELLEPAGCSAERFPFAYLSTDIVGEVDGEAAALTGLPAGLPVVAGGPDGTVGAMAAVGDSADVVVDVAGTTDVITRVVSAPPDVDADVTSAAIVNPFPAPARWSYGGPTGMTGGAVQTMCRLLDVGPVEALPQETIDAMERIPPGCDGLAVLPETTGSRFPYWRSGERGALWGLGEDHDRVHLIRATQEGSAFVVRAGIDALDGCGMPVTLAGGVARSPALAQLRADVLGRRVTTCRQPDVSLHGAAILALVGTGQHADVASAQAETSPQSRTHEPDGARAARYDRLFHEWQERRQAVWSSESWTDPLPAEPTPHADRRDPRMHS